MPQELSQDISLRQKQILHQDQIHSLEFLTASAQELQQKINEEMQTNPLLEPGDDPEVESGVPEEENDFPENLPDDGFGILAEPPEDEGINEERDDLSETVAKMLENGSSPWEDSFRGEDGEDRVSSFSETEERRRNLFNSVAGGGPSLQEFLLDQLRYADCSEEVRRAAVEIIGSIDDTGFLRTAEGDIAQSASCSLETVEEALRLVQSFDPPGIAARSVRECLLLQLQRKDIRSGNLYLLVRDHLEDIAHNRLPQIARAMSLSINEVNDLIRELRRLNPHPASGFAPEETASCIVPECTVFRDDSGEFAVAENRDSIPRFHVPHRYIRMLEDPLVSAGDKQFIREKLDRISALRKDLERRGSTIRRIAEQIVSEQHDFFEKGPEKLRPMTRKEIADKLGYHETTISRAIAGKYMMTPFGLAAFQDFFSGGFSSDDGEDVSVRTIKKHIADAVASEDPARPLSDSGIEKILAAHGLKVARRTIAKYREELGIASSQMRRKYT